MSPNTILAAIVTTIVILSYIIGFTLARRQCEQIVLSELLIKKDLETEYLRLQNSTKVSQRSQTAEKPKKVFPMKEFEQKFMTEGKAVMKNF